MARAPSDSSHRSTPGRARSAHLLAGSSGLSKVAAIGDPLPGGGTLATFTLYPVITLSQGGSGSLTFAATAMATGQGIEGVYLATPSR